MSWARFDAHLALTAILVCLFLKVKAEGSGRMTKSSLHLKRSLGLSVIQLSHLLNEDSDSYADKPRKILSRSN